MIIVAILNAGRNSFSFFLLLIVCMGYGVVKPSLGRTMIYVRILAITHFIFGVIYGIASLTVTPDSAGPLVLLVVLPLAGTMTAFYVWTLNSLNMTMKDLADRKQKTKAMMYKKLWWCLLGSIIVIFGFFFINSLAFAGRNAANFVPEHWKTRWFVLDGWLNIVYFFDIAFIAYLWRPTANNRRFAMSDEVSLRPYSSAQSLVANWDYSLPKTTMDSKSVLWQTFRMKRGLWLARTTPTAVSRSESCRLFHQSQCNRHRIIESPWMARRSLPSARMETSGPTMRTKMRLLETRRMRGRSSQEPRAHDYACNPGVC